MAAMLGPYTLPLSVLELDALARIPNAIPAPAGRRMKKEIKKGIAEDIIGYHLWGVTVLYLHFFLSKTCKSP